MQQDAISNIMKEIEKLKEIFEDEKASDLTFTLNSFPVGSKGIKNLINQDISNQVIGIITTELEERKKNRENFNELENNYPDIFTKSVYLSRCDEGDGGRGGSRGKEYSKTGYSPQSGFFNIMNQMRAFSVGKTEEQFKQDLYNSDEGKKLIDNVEGVINKVEGHNFGSGEDQSHQHWDAAVSKEIKTNPQERLAQVMKNMKILASNFSDTPDKRLQVSMKTEASKIIASMNDLIKTEVSIKKDIEKASIISIHNTESGISMTLDKTMPSDEFKQMGFKVDGNTVSFAFGDKGDMVGSDKKESRINCASETDAKEKIELMKKYISNADEYFKVTTSISAGKDGIKHTNIYTQSVEFIKVIRKKENSSNTTSKTTGKPGKNTQSQTPNNDNVGKKLKAAINQLPKSTTSTTYIPPIHITGGKRKNTFKKILKNKKQRPTKLYLYFKYKNGHTANYNTYSKRF